MSTRAHHPVAAGAPAGSSGAGWSVPLSLIALSAIPLAAGSLRLVQLAGGPAIMPADHRFTGFPVALVVHIVGAAVYALLGALQFVPPLRQPGRAWHRRAGGALVVAGGAVAVSGLWLTLFYAPQPGSGPVLYVARLLAGSAMASSLMLGITAIRRRDIASHRAWMMRAYALALGAGTQAFTEGIGGGIFGTGELRNDLYKTAGWVINVVVAEWAIRHRSHRPIRPHVPLSHRHARLGTARISQGRPS